LNSEPVDSTSPSDNEDYDSPVSPLTPRNNFTNIDKELGEKSQNQHGILIGNVTHYCLN